MSRESFALQQICCVDWHQTIGLFANLVRSPRERHQFGNSLDLEDVCRYQEMY